MKCFPGPKWHLLKIVIKQHKMIMKFNPKMIGKKTIPGKLIIALVFSVSALHAQEPVHWDMVQKIMDEGFNNSHIMEDASWLTDVYGPRNAKSPSYLAAANWAKNRLTEYGLSNARLQPYDFAKGYVYEFISVHMMKPQYMPIIAYPTTWSSGTDGEITGPAVHIDFNEVKSLADLEPFRGKLKNAIILTHPKQEIQPHFEPLGTRYTKKELDEMASVPIGPQPEQRRRRRTENDKLSRQEIIDFVFAQGAAVLIRTDGRNDFGTVAVENTRYTLDNRPWEKDAPALPPELVMSAEHYNRIMRILEKGIPVEIQVDLRISFTTEDPFDYNVLAEFPGSDLKEEIIVVGGHLQANPAGTGAADNVAGAVVAMEAVRILKAIGVQPRRTIRVGMWGGHEMGVFGNRAHVAKYFADPETKEYKADYENFCAYFDLDLGSGKIRGIPVHGNEELRGIFLEWIKPLENLGMTHVVTHGGYHEAYEAVGLNAFTFLQDNMEERTYHSNMDTYDRLVPENMMINAVIVASFLYHAAMRDEKLPRVAPLPW